MAMTADAFVNALVFLLYAPICLVVARWLAPRLSPSFRLLAIGMLAAQIVLLAAGLQNIPRWDTVGWLVGLDQEWNFPSTFASVQLALVSAAAFLAALLARARPAQFRLNFVALGLLFLAFAWDEYFYLHEDNMPLKITYVIVSVAIILSTSRVALRSPRRAAIWQISLMAGMALYFLGAVLLEPFHETCLDLGFIRLEGCVRFYNLEESLEFLGVWLALVAVLGNLTEARAKPGMLAPLLLFALPILWPALLTKDAWLPRAELHFRAQPAAVQFESGPKLRGYRLERDEDTVVLWLYPSAWRSHYRELGFSLHLVDPAGGASVASRNLHSDVQSYLLLAPAYAHVYRQNIALEIPPDAPKNRAYWIALSFWRDRGDDYETLKIIASDHELLGDSLVVLDDLVLPSEEAAPTSAPLAIFDGGITLSDAELPDQAMSGEALPIRFAWTAAIEGAEDYIQFLHFGHQASGEWWVYDQQPLGDRLPTRFWYAGLSDSETWQVPLPADLAPGLYRAFTGLYRLDDHVRLAATDFNGEPYVDARVPLGDLIIEERG